MVEAELMYSRRYNQNDEELRAAPVINPAREIEVDGGCTRSRSTAVVALPAARYAVVRFPGLSRPADVERRTETLRAFMARQQLRATSPPSLARYNPAWRLWLMRRNEVWIPVEPAG